LSDLAINDYHDPAVLSDFNLGDIHPRLGGALMAFIKSCWLKIDGTRVIVLKVLV